MKEVKLNGFTLHILPDEDPVHPRSDCDNLGHLLCWHRNYDIGDDNPYTHSSGFWQDKALQGSIFVMLEVYGLDHSGIRVSCSPYNDLWDSGKLGIIYATKDDVLKEFGDLADETKELVKNRLIGEVTDYDNYLITDFYYFLIEGPDGEHIDSCGSFSGNNMQDICENMKEHTSDEFHPLFDKFISKQAGSHM